MIDLDNKALQILQTNDQGGYTVPTQGMYPYQWNWDSAFVALGFATFDMDRAIAEIETLFEAQWDNGMVPHIVFRVDDPGYFPGPSVWNAGQTLPSSGITQPPVAAFVVESLWKRANDEDHKARLKALFPKLFAYHKWFKTYRDYENLGVVVTVHPWETGRDNCPEWDEPLSAVKCDHVAPYKRRDLDHADAAMRPTMAEYDRYIALVEYGRSVDWDPEIIASQGPFRVADVGMTMILLRSNKSLLNLANEYGDAESASEITTWINQTKSGVDYLWDDETKTYCCRDTINGRFSGLVTNASFLSFFANVGSPDQRARQLAHWDRITAETKFMVPSCDPASSSFDASRYWRGPIWAVVNYMVALGLSEIGEALRYQQVLQDTKTLIELSEFPEAFNPITGEGSGGESFSWTAAMWLAWAQQDIN